VVTQRDIDIWRVEAKEKIRKMYEDWRKDYLGRRFVDPKREDEDANRRTSQPDY